MPVATGFTLLFGPHLALNLLDFHNFSLIANPSSIKPFLSVQRFQFRSFFSKPSITILQMLLCNEELCDFFLLDIFKSHFCKPLMTSNHIFMISGLKQWYYTIRFQQKIQIFQKNCFYVCISKI